MTRHQPRRKKESCPQCGRSKKYLYYAIDSDCRNDAICSSCFEEEQAKRVIEELKVDNYEDALRAVSRIRDDNEDVAKVLQYLLTRLPGEIN